MDPTSLISALNHAQITSRKTAGDGDTQVNKVASTRTGRPRERLTTETLLALSCQLHIISLNIIWTLFCCQKCVEISEAEGLAARSNSCTKSNMMLSARNYSPLAWGNLPATHRVRDPHPYGTWGLLRINFSGDNKIKHHVEPSLHHCPTHFRNLFLGSGKLKKVLLICEDCEGGKKSGFVLFLVHICNLLSSCRNPRVTAYTAHRPRGRWFESALYLVCLSSDEREAKENRSLWHLGRDVKKCWRVPTEAVIPKASQTMLKK